VSENHSNNQKKNQGGEEWASFHGEPLINPAVNGEIVYRLLLHLSTFCCLVCLHHSRKGSRTTARENNTAVHQCLIFTLYRENEVLRMISIHSEKLVEMPPDRLSLLSSQASSPMLEGQMSMP
jgi:hypothetical protein